MTYYNQYADMTPPWYTSVDLINNGPLDPDLNDSITTAHGTDPWSPHQLSPRSLVDPRKAPFPGHSTLESIYINGRPVMITPFPSSMLQRHSSPSEHPSSTCSSALSPRGGSDYGLDYSPPTPRDEINLSTYSNQFDTWGAQGQLFPLTGLTDECVKPGDVNISPEPLINYGEDNNSEFSLRGLSMSTNGSGYDLDHNTRLEPIRIPRQMSPVEMAQEIKAEIRIPDMEQTETYPPLESEDDTVASEDETETLHIKDEDNDGDYTPRKTHSRTSSNANRNSKSRKRPATSQPISQAKKAKLEPVISVATTPSTKASMPGTRASFPCQECRDISFKDESSLQKHIKQQHTRPFICVFHFAGCDSTFASKNEWKRHVTSQHLLLHYWLCQENSCAKLSNTSGGAGKARNRPNSFHPQTHPAAPSLPNGAIFNRKDLYTQHLRRMHTPPGIKKQVKQKKSVPEWEERVRVHQDEAHKLRCDLPAHMECPAVDCTAQFEGLNAWDERMEHVAKHLEKAATGSETRLLFGGDNDSTLMGWAVRPEVAVIKTDSRGKWVLNNPLRPEKNSRPQPQQPRQQQQQRSPVYNDEDAEGEDE